MAQACQHLFGEAYPFRFGEGGLAEMGGIKQRGGERGAQLVGQAGGHFTHRGEALVALEGDPVAKAWFPDELLTTYLAVKRTEIAAFHEVDAATMCERYRLAY